MYSLVLLSLGWIIWQTKPNGNYSVGIVVGMFDFFASFRLEILKKVIPVRHSINLDEEG